MIMKSKAVQENFYHEYYSGKFNANEFVKEFCQMLLQISLFRKINEEYRFNFNFQCISICDCFNKGNETFDWEDTKHKLELANRELTYKFNIIVNKVEKEAQKCFTEDELGMLTDGHDLVRLMAAASYKNISHSNLEVVLRAMYRKDDYLKTEVYQSITRYLDNGTT